MSVENPTGGDDTGASITDRIEAFLGAGDGSDDKRREPVDAQPAAAQQQETEQHEDDHADQPDEGDRGEDQGPQLSTTDLAKVFGIDESMLDVGEDGAAVIKTKIDGKEGTAKFADLLRTYQMQGHVDNRAREVAAQQQMLQQRAAQADQVIQQKLEQLDSSINLANQELTREFQSVDWQYLRSTDPGEYSAKLADFQLRQSQIDGAAQRAQQGRHELMAQQQEQSQQQLANERARLPELIPEWKDQAVAARESIEIRNWGLQNGFAEAELNGIVRGPAVVAMRKAMLYDRQQTSRAAVEAKVRTAPKLVKAGQAPSVNRQQNTVRTLRSNVRNSGGSTDAVAAFLLGAGKV